MEQNIVVNRALMDSDPHPKTALRFLAQFLLDYGNQKHDSLIVELLRLADSHNPCIVRGHRTPEAVYLISCAVTIIDQLVAPYDLCFLLENTSDGYQHYHFAKISDYLPNRKEAFPEDPRQKNPSLPPHHHVV